MQRKINPACPIFFAAAGLALLPAGCPRTPPTTAVTPGPTFAGVVVRVACPDERSAKVVKNYAAGWSGRSGATVEVVPFDPGKVSPDGPDADVWLLAPEELPRWAAAGKLRPVPEDLTAARESSEALLPLYRNKLLVWDHVPYALPLLGESPLCFYRADLIDGVKYQADFETAFGRKPAAPRTWEEFEEVARFFKGRSEAGFDGPSLPPLPADDDGLDREFFAVAAPFARRAVALDEPKQPSAVEAFSFHYDLQTLRPRLASAGFVHALQLLQRLQQCRPAEAAAEPAEAFAQGKAVLCLADATWIQRFQKGAVRDNFAVCRMPGAGTVFGYGDGKPQAVPGGNFVSYLGTGGRLAAVPQRSPQAEAAFALLADLTGPQTSRQIVIEPAWGGGPVRADHLNKNPAGWFSFGLNQQRTAALREALRMTLDPPGVRNGVVLRLRVPDERAYQKELLEELRPALAAGAGPDKAHYALDAAARRWEARDRDKDEKERRAEYLLSLSLQPD